MNRSNTHVFRGFKFEPDKEIELKNYFGMASGIKQLLIDKIPFLS